MRERDRRLIENSIPQFSAEKRVAPWVGSYSWVITKNFSVDLPGWIYWEGQEWIGGEIPTDWAQLIGGSARILHESVQLVYTVICGQTKFAQAHSAHEGTISLIGEDEMKKHSLIWLVIVGISFLSPILAMAEPTHPNEVGLYTTPDGYGPTGTFVVGVPVDVYLILTKPADIGETGEPFVSVYGFECHIFFNPIPDNDLLLIETVLRPGSIDIGRYKDINEGFLEFVVGTTIEDPIPVINETVELAKFTFLNLGQGITEVTLGPAGDPMFEGEMAFLGGFLPSWGPRFGRVMHPVSGSHEAPVFMFNGDAVALENESFGSVKALYR